MSNKKGFITFQEITSGSFAFIWQTAMGGYKLLEGSTHKVIDGLKPPVDSSDHWLVRTAEEPYTARRYAPLTKPTLHRKFAQVFSGESIIQFANKYGMLGQVKMVAPSSGGECSYVESLSVWKNESRDMGRLLAIWDMVSRSDAGKLGQLVKWPDAQFVLLEAQRVYDSNRGEWRVEPLSMSDKPMPFGSFRTTIAATNEHGDVFGR